MGFQIINLAREYLYLVSVGSLERNLAMS